jgi:hypothetical protein
MRNWALGTSFALLLLGSSACGGDDADKFAALADEVCECKDKACADKVEQKWEALEDEMKKKYEGKKMDEKEMEAMGKKYKAAEDKAEACVEKLK